MKYCLPQNGLKLGYTLVELSIVIIIIGLLMAGGLAVGASMVERAAYVDTRKLIDQLEQSLIDFYIVNGQLPCVAPIDLAPGDAGFGVEAADCSAGGTAPDGTWRQGTVRIGGIPTRTLGLPDSAAADKFGSRFVYAVSEQLTDANLFGGAEGSITVRDVNGVDILTDSAFFIASLGRDRKGAYTHLSGEHTSDCLPATNLDALNCDSSNAVFRDAPFNNGDIDDRFFDDITAWAPKFHFMSFDNESSNLWTKRADNDNIYAVGADEFPENTRVGIGVSNPLIPLHVEGTSAHGINYTRTDARDARISVSDPTQQWSLASGWATAGDFSLVQEDDGSGPSAGNRLYVQNSTGNVGLSTSDPDYRLHMIGDIKLESNSGSHIVSENPHGSLVMNFPATGGATTNGFWVRSNATAGDFSTYSNLLVVRPTGRVGINESNPAAQLHVTGHALLEGCCLGYYSTGSPVGKRVWRAGVQSADSMFFIGYRTNDQISSLGAKGTYSIEPFRIFNGAGNGALDILSNSTVRATVVAPSDRRLKRDVESMQAEEVLAKLRRLNPVSYYWRDMKRQRQRQFGFIAQDVREIWPELVTGEEAEDSYLSINYDSLIAPLVMGTQQLFDRQEAITARLDALEQPMPDESYAPAETPVPAPAPTTPVWAWLIMLCVAALAWRVIVLQRQVNTLIGK